jgi:hypothetical protein
MQFLKIGHSIKKKSIFNRTKAFFGNENNAHEMEAINNHKLFFQSPLGSLMHGRYFHVQMGGGEGRGGGIMPYSTSFHLAPKFNDTYHLAQMLIIQQNDDTFELDNLFWPCYVDDKCSPCNLRKWVPFQKQQLPIVTC